MLPGVKVAAKARGQAETSGSGECHELADGLLWSPRCRVAATILEEEHRRLRPRAVPEPPDPAGLAAGFMIILCIVGTAGLCALIGLPFGLALPLGLAGAAIGVVLGFFAVWVRFFRNSR